MAVQTFEANDIETVINLFGEFDKHAKMIEQKYHVRLMNRDNVIKIEGEDDDVLKAKKVLFSLANIIKKGEILTEQNITYAMTLVEDGIDVLLSDISKDTVCITAKGKPIKPKTLGQKKYIKSMEKNTVVFGIGPAGTGKTYLAVAMAVKAFKNKEVSRIILTRPAVEAGEKLGFLPGDLQTKVDPYLRPLYDALYDMFGLESYQRYVERGEIEIAPLAYMRGRTLDDAFIILDEAQNTTGEQMKMFLTRIGFGSRAVVTGDITQIDLPAGKKSGLKEAQKVLQGVEDIEFCQFSEKDVVRHPLVQSIIKAYEKYDRKQNVEAAKRFTVKRGGGQK